MVKCVPQVSSSCHGYMVKIRRCTRSNFQVPYLFILTDCHFKARQYNLFQKLKQTRLLNDSDRKKVSPLPSGLPSKTHAHVTNINTALSNCCHAVCCRLGGKCAWCFHAIVMVLDCLPCPQCQANATMLTHNEWTGLFAQVGGYFAERQVNKKRIIAFGSQNQSYKKCFLEKKIMLQCSS